MLKADLNERITRTDAGTPMGDVFRRYWIPAVLSEELPHPDCPPVRVRILGEDLVVFRDSNGDVGLLDAYCPHRQAHLFWGRNEECGLRCVYHGWKFDITGQCVDMPNEPPESNFKHKVKITSYPCWEAGGIVWTYMGPPQEQPPCPDYEWLRAPESHRFVSKTFEDCNYLQALEGGIDTSHSSFAHNNNLQDKNALRTRATAPKLEVHKADHGFTYVGIRDLGDDGLYVRAYQFVMPAQQMRGSMTNWSTGEAEEHPTINGHIWVPVDDEHCIVYNWMYSADPNHPLPRDYCIKHETLFGRGPANTLPGYRLARNKSNDYMIDRENQRTKTFTGIQGINTQDFALQETMRPIVDRSKEHLGSADAAIIVARQLLLEATRDVESGEAPRGVRPDSHRDIRGCDHILPRGVSWQEGLAGELVARF
ncbi:Rieske 2Fe-2S domain-containing protein [Alicyclobacillus fastidiosus]|uniref:Rieske 2Fe-2S domain-containing protein n=1 Tax=Alicyclobacillus fastidiosus TaxID=392011 RepID=A0ABV5AHW0_9BACL|nr:Rieske 2Fe-2S domain-containing protein [Alicyclobacillus fastidiosus]WEH11596.1 Rieske 2Fe-2S domain-containing protein [Alicyclobacillus fastidiosus]